jgi:hypothetical protein
MDCAPLNTAPQSLDQQRTTCFDPFRCHLPDDVAAGQNPEQEAIMMKHMALTAFAVVLLAGCTGVTGSRVVVERAGPDEILKLRAGRMRRFRPIDFALAQSRWADAEVSL